MKGRVVIDCGFTKLNRPFWNTTAGTERYVRNCAVWLLGLEYRIKVGAPIRGSIHAKEVETIEKEKEKEESKEEVETK